MKALKQPLINLAFRYLLIPLNISMIVWIILMNHAFVRPTSQPTSYAIRSKGYWHFTVVYISLCLFTILIGALNVFIVYTAIANVPRRLHKFKSASTFSCCRTVHFYKAYAAIILVLLGSYGLIGTLAFHDLFARQAFEHACDGFSLMAEVYVQPDFPLFDGTHNTPTASASSSIRFYKDGRFRFTMDLVRQWNQTLGFVHSLESAEADPNWGTFELSLRMPTERAPLDSLTLDGVSYFNVSQALYDQTYDITNALPPPSILASIQYSLLNLSYIMTFANSSAPGFPPITRQGGFSPRPLAFVLPELGLEQTRVEWRFTDHVCLPPRLVMRGKYHMEESVIGGAAKGCESYRLCALKKVNGNGGAGPGWREWWDWVESVWPVIAGLVS